MPTALEFAIAHEAQFLAERRKPIGGVDTGNPTRDAEILAKDLQTLAERKESGLEKRRVIFAIALGIQLPEPKPH